MQNSSLDHKGNHRDSPVLITFSNWSVDPNGGVRVGEEIEVDVTFVAYHDADFALLGCEFVQSVTGVLEIQEEVLQAKVFAPRQFCKRAPFPGGTGLRCPTG